MAEEGYVKGTWMMDFIKTLKLIKKLPDFEKDFKPEWDKYLKDQDWELTKDEYKIFPATKIPISQYKRFSSAMFFVGARGDTDLARKFGRVMMRDTFSQTYDKMIIVPGNPVESINKFNGLRDNFFKGIGETRSSVEEHTDNHAKIKTIISIEDAAFKAIVAYPWQLAGNIEELVEIAKMNVDGELRNIIAKSEVESIDLKKREIYQTTRWKLAP